jgi:hypothetical protein
VAVFQLKYDAERHPTMARALARSGLTKVEIGTALGVSRDTVRRWSNAYPDFCTALKGGRIEADALVEDSLFRRALGYDFEETEVSVSEDGKAKRAKKTKRHMAPDVAACIFWLANRRPDRWRRNPDAAVQGDDTNNLKALADLLAKTAEGFKNA